ncbi:hypothetical protein HHL16_24460 [Pseudoflavitalea sp. G-6-1-2]|uniref:RNA polymerase sigma factor n=1 Tax=Pseudoflavitalea sp. G-6-1-2 TaxID=2728841 RepID=UPI00146F15E7|nr:hypothetical protein [Pseudoflavitalea sp. G-6-1-2]NML24053.1 hypothetical protein [Pseudoflavitalea sp. G-6-1-2]
MSHVHRWTGYPFLPDPALLLKRLRAGDQSVLGTLFFHFYPALCFFAERLISDAPIAQQIAEESLGSLWQHRQSFHQPQEIKQFLYINTYQACNQFTRSVSNTEKTITAIACAELFIYLSEIADASQWLQQRLLQLPPA